MSSDLAYEATGKPEDGQGLPAVGFLTGVDTNNTPRFVFGGRMNGSVTGIWGQAGGGDAGLLGKITALAGVVGTSPEGASGVYGQSEATSTAPSILTAGVLGTADTSAGVVGWSTTWNGIEGWAAQGTGVLGLSEIGYGVQGASTWQPGVLGWSTNDLGVMGGSGPDGTQGPTVPNTSNIAGVVGTSDRQHGVIGTSNASVGVIGFSNNIGVLGYTTNPQGQAGYFIGDVIVDGNFYVISPPPPNPQHQKSVAVPFPDGTLRALYCMESPELWFEDFGAGKLKSGRAVVKIDPNFAKVIKPTDYRVFITPEGDCRGLYVRRKAAATFELRELGGGKSSVAFSYRIVGARKDVRGHKRFAKVDIPRLLSSAGTRAPRKPASTAAGVRALVARAEKEARRRRRNVGRSRGSKS
jgi:hypothetical protein